MASFLTDVEGFTPVIDVVVADTNLITAVVYGRVWRYCQMQDGVCKASLKTIGKDIGMSRKTVQRHIKALCDKGYLRSLTPARVNAPRVYADTGKAIITGLVSAKKGRTESPTDEVGRTESPRGLDRESDLGRTESPKKIVDSSKETYTPTAGDTRPTGEVLTFNEWIDEIGTSKNKQAVVARMVASLFPRKFPDGIPRNYYGRVAKTAKHRNIKTYDRLAQLIWQAASYRPTGDVLSYCIGLARNGGKPDDAPLDSDSIEQRDGKTVVKLGR